MKNKKTNPYATAGYASRNPDSFGTTKKKKEQKKKEAVRQRDRIRKTTR